jgi:hypothetical protein
MITPIVEETLRPAETPRSVELPPLPTVYPGIGQVTPRALTIGSVHFEDCSLHLWHSGRRLYQLPPPPVKCLSEVTLSNVSLLTAYDSQQWIPMITDPEAPMRLAPAPVPVEVIVQDLLHQWTMNRIGAANRHPPGIIQLAGPKPTQAELKRMVELETAHCNALVDEADEIFVTKKGTLQPSHRQALNWLGSTRKEWFKPIEIGRMKRSVVSGREIPMEALADGSEKLIDYYLLYGFNPMDYGDEYVAKLFSNPRFLSEQRGRLGLGLEAKRV